jgi:hypothetical protein
MTAALKHAVEEGFDGDTSKIADLSGLPHVERNHEVKFPNKKTLRCLFIPRSIFTVAELHIMDYGEPGKLRTITKICLSLG